LWDGTRLLRAEISASADKARSSANDADAVTITARLSLPEQTKLELYVDDAKVTEPLPTHRVRAQFILIFAEPGTYDIEVRDTTPPLPGQPQLTKYLSVHLVRGMQISISATVNTIA